MTDEERLNKIALERDKALEDNNNLYNDLLNENEKLYNQKNEYANQWQTTQDQILDNQLQSNIDLINQQKEKAEKSKKIETNKALNDYAAYINPYGHQAERIAENGLNNSGVSETSKLGAYTTYQNRISAANTALQDAITAYDNDINAARRENDAAKAQNALEKLQMQINFADAYVTGKANYGQNQLTNNQNISSDYFNRENTIRNQINDEKERQAQREQWEREFNESIRQFNENQAFKQQQAAQEQANWEKEYALSQAAANSKYYSNNNNYYGNPLDGSSLEGTTSQNGVSIVKNPYTGNINTDAQYGVFKNRYQPNNVSGDPLIPSEYKVGDVYAGAKGSTGVDLSKQQIWQSQNGKRYYVWDGSINDYIDATDTVNYFKRGGNGPFVWGV